MLAYAGVNLSSPDGPLAAHLESRLPTADLYDLTRLDYPGEPLASLGCSAAARQRPPKLGRLYWPTGASRCAVGYFIITTNRLEQIRQQVYSSSGGSVSSAQPFVINDGKRNLTTNLWMLPPRPITQIEGNNDAWLLTLVDERYWWWKKTANIAVNPGTTSWTDLYSSIGTALGVTITVDPIPSAYGQPPDDFTVGYDYLPPLLDAVAASVGQRIVRDFAGGVRAWNATNSRTQLTANLNLNPLLAGGQMQTLAPNNADNAALLPQSVTVVFPRSDGGTPLQGACTTVVQTLTSLTLGNDFTGIKGAPWTKIIRTSLVAKYTPSSSQAQNATELSNYAKQAATDFYQWAVAPMDAVYSGVLNWIPEGLTDSLEFFHVNESIYTRVQRPPWQREDTILLAYGSDGSQNIATVDRTGFDAQITGQPDPTKALYSFKEVVDDGTGSAWMTAVGGQTGTGNAFELNNNLSVPVGTWVRMRKRSRTRGFFEFSAQSSLFSGAAYNLNGTALFSGSLDLSLTGIPRYDTDGYLPVGQTTFVAPVAAYYQAVFTVFWSGVPAHTQLILQVNSSDYCEVWTPGIQTSPIMQAVFTDHLVAGQTVVCTAYTSNTCSVNTGYATISRLGR